METIRQLLYNVTCFHYNVYRSTGILPYGETRTYNNVTIMTGTPKGGQYLPDIEQGEKKEWRKN